MGGVQRYLMNIAYGLKHYDVDSTILTRYYPPLPRREIGIPFSVVRVGFNPFPYSNHHLLGMATAKLGDIFTYTILGQYHAMPIARDSLVIHSQYAIETDIELGRKLALRAKKPHVITVHTRFGNQEEDVRPSKKLISRLKEADYVIVNRRSSYDFLRDQDIDSIVEMGNPIPTTFYSQQKKRSESVNEPLRFLFIGRLVKRRGPHLAIKAFETFARMERESELWVVGTGSMERWLKDYIDIKGLKQRVKFFGNQIDVRPFLRDCDVFLATSEIANSPSLALREAMAAGLAIIATDVEDTNTIVVHKTHGLLTTVDANCIASAMRSMAQNPEGTARFGGEAQRKALEEFDVLTYAQKLLKIYRNVSGT